MWQFYFIATCVPEAHTIIYEAGESFGIGRTDDLRIVYEHILNRLKK